MLPYLLQYQIIKNILMKSFSARKINLTPNQHAKRIDFANLGFGKYFSPHMLEVNWSKNSGWEDPKIVPYANLSLDPSCSSLHYAISCFEGMKAYKNKTTNDVLLFRPQCNAQRFLESSRRLCLPEFYPDEFVQCIQKLVSTDSKYVPDQSGTSLYIRPFMFSTDPTLSIVPPASAKLLVITSPSGSYFSGTQKPVNLIVNSKNKRAWKGGTGNYKVSANYAPTILPQLEAQKKGYDQVLWLGNGGEIAEVGAMNVMCLWINQDGKRELITPPLDDGIILPGITRDSVLELCRNKKDLVVSEKKYTIDDVILAVKEKRMIEMFGTGTAVVISPIGTIYTDNDDVHRVGVDHAFSQEIYKELTDIQYGNVSHSWSVKV